MAEDDTTSLVSVSTKLLQTFTAAGAHRLPGSFHNRSYAN